ncbi:hypothetical protein N7E02_03685 (plasmid) [Aliirhizobium terrae]|uniref:hypothetical protein n=1 Tax=Terrirhizobium terrae TaxID=2926709 RepID=UPI002576578D|nr:hypothetical protein [Rhizobium sp. CC-CFT758]WJH38527.1 hypothetical protein N7E02_03685 [Rhizobium sp. CC-CFT758]
MADVGPRKLCDGCLSAGRRWAAWLNRGQHAALASQSKKLRENNCLCNILLDLYLAIVDYIIRIIPI